MALIKYGWTFVRLIYSIVLIFFADSGYRNVIQNLSLTNEKKLQFFSLTIIITTLEYRLIPF